MKDEVVQAVTTEDAAQAPRSSRRSAASGRINLFGLDREQLRAVFADMGEKPYRADQIMQWIYRRGVDSFDAMSNVSKDLRTRMQERFEIRHPELLAEQLSQDGTRKWVLKLDGGNAIETVFIPEGDFESRLERVAPQRFKPSVSDESDASSAAESDTTRSAVSDKSDKRYRGTLCISSQVGCAMDCSFCSTAQQGLNRNLTTAEVIAQVWFAAKTLGGDFQNERVISNVVFMGMGEPLANYGQVTPAIGILQDDFGFGLSKRRVTVSTSGLVPFMDRLRADCDTALAVSLHAPNDELRNRLVPINRKYPIAELMAACRRYTAGKERKMHIVYEYVMLDGVNDAPEHARQLAKLLAGMPAKVNLIPFNPFPEAQYKRSKPEAIKRFADILREKHIMTTTRRTRGDDIDAACGQLVGRVQSKQKQRLRDVGVRVEAAVPPGGR
ncbi:23S rRNA (adenine(2503)-C(2))-methyltransferase RlmN [Hydrocarboniphaga effusa]|jgi:23S rRNA (adenine2503-C2)-methyltransferase|uniref:23S rRNA (adenine(2503)-C(2))-methyltransferase RlmN n=1 Tax=Hydrocarboniphaga effusa TaxID=243629 RepID=UPI003BA90CC5